jgi:hypothetical protein
VPLIRERKAQTAPYVMFWWPSLRSGAAPPSPSVLPVAGCAYGAPNLPQPAVDLTVGPLDRRPSCSLDAGCAANHARSGNCSVSLAPGLDRGIQSCLHGVVNVQPHPGSSPFSLHSRLRRRAAG